MLKNSQRLKTSKTRPINQLPLQNCKLKKLPTQAYTHIKVVLIFTKIKGYSQVLWGSQTAAKFSHGEGDSTAGSSLFPYLQYLGIHLFLN